MASLNLMDLIRGIREINTARGSRDATKFLQTPEGQAAFVSPESAAQFNPGNNQFLQQAKQQALTGFAQQAANILAEAQAAVQEAGAQRTRQTALLERNAATANPQNPGVLPSDTGQIQANLTAEDLRREGQLEQQFFMENEGVPSARAFNALTQGRMAATGEANAQAAREAAKSQAELGQIQAIQGLIEAAGGAFTPNSQGAQMLNALATAGSGASGNIVGGMFKAMAESAQRAAAEKAATQEAVRKAMLGEGGVPTGPPLQRDQATGVVQVGQNPFETSAMQQAMDVLKAIGPRSTSQRAARPQGFTGDPKFGPPPGLGGQQQTVDLGPQFGNIDTPEQAQAALEFLTQFIQQNQQNLQAVPRTSQEFEQRRGAQTQFQQAQQARQTLLELLQILESGGQAFQNDIINQER